MLAVQAQDLPGLCRIGGLKISAWRAGQANRQEAARQVGLVQHEVVGHRYAGRLIGLVQLRRMESTTSKGSCSQTDWRHATQALRTADCEVSQLAWHCTVPLAKDPAAGASSAA